MSRLSAPLTGLRLAVRGLWFRRSTALIVLGLAVVASAASVVAPLYARAAEESIVRSTLQRASTYEIGMHLTHPQSDVSVDVAREETPEFSGALVRQDLKHPAFGSPRLAHQTAGHYRLTNGPNRSIGANGRVVERAGVCARLPVVTGRCATAPDEVVVSRRSLPVLGAKVGDTVALTLRELVRDRNAPAPVVRLRIVGAYEPVAVTSTYWAGQPYFREFFPQALPSGLSVAPPTVDPAFAGPGTAAAHRINGFTLDVPLLTDRVRLEDAPELLRQLRLLQSDESGYGVGTFSNLPAAISRADHGRDLVRVAAPLAVTQLVLLAWWTLYLVVGSATEERAPELGLAKLRGLSRGQLSRFGLAEILLLLVLAAPLGTLVGYVAVRAAAGRVFAPGTEVVLTGSVLQTVTIALAGAAVTVALAARRIFRRPVGDLLRRVPGRHGRRGATVVEGAVVALAVAAVAQLASDRGGEPSPVALLAPGMVAVVGAVVASRWLVGVARNRSAVALARGKAARLVGWSGVARRPGTARIASVLAFATCLLIVGVEAWSVAERNRVERASAEVGAAVVLSVRAPDTTQLLTAVRAADPSGRYAMAAVTVASPQLDQVLAVDGSRADRVMRWGAPADRPGSVRDLIAPALPPSLTVRPGPITVTGRVSRVDSPSPMTMSARLDDHGTTVPVPLGVVTRDTTRWSGTVPERCATGCRLAAIGLTHPLTDFETADAQLSLTGVSAVTGPGPAHPLRTGFADRRAWRPSAAPVGGAQVVLRPGRALRVRVNTPGGFDAEAVRGDSPEPLPAYAGSGVVLDSEEAGAVPVVTAGGLSGTDTRYRRVDRGPFVPRLGQQALLVDLQLALRGTTEAPEGDRQVWLARDDAAAERRLTRALAARGVRVVDREAEASVERGYAGDGAVLALRLLLVCGAAAVLVAVGALLVAAYVGRRQRAYEVAALRVVGLRRRTVRAMLLRENLGTVVVALLCGAGAALVASWVVLPSLPQFDEPSTMIAARYPPAAGPAWAALGALAAGLAAVGLAVTTVQLRAGRSDRLREGVR